MKTMLNEKIWPMLLLNMCESPKNVGPFLGIGIDFWCRIFFSIGQCSGDVMYYFLLSILLPTLNGPNLQKQPS